jgi:tetratricopeptide (TPR) repeat protein
MNQPPRGTELEGHLTPEELAVLAERGRDGAAREALEHLARCRSCMSAYADLVRYRAGWLSFPEAFDGDEDTERRSGRVHAPIRRSRLRRTAWQAAAAGVVLVLGLGAWWRAGRLESPRDADPLTTLIENASATSHVIQGGEAGAARSGSLYRSDSPPAEGVEQVLDSLRAEYESSKSHQDIPRLSAGLLAAGQLDLARYYIAEGLHDSPRDERLLTLAGIVAYGSGDTVLAEQRLRAALDNAPENVTAMLDLGLVLADARGIDPAMPYLNEVIRRVPRSPLAERARGILAQHSRP